jgi:hypothetical protein
MYNRPIHAALEQAASGGFMRHSPNREGDHTRPKLSEDWLSVIIGLILVIVVWLFGGAGIPWPLFGVLT